MIDELIDDQEEARDSLTQIHETAEPDGRRELADVLIAGLVRLSVAEETVTYPVFRKYLPNVPGTAGSRATGTIGVHGRAGGRHQAGRPHPATTTTEDLT